MFKPRIATTWIAALSLSLAAGCGSGSTDDADSAADTSGTSSAALQPETTASTEQATTQETTAAETVPPATEPAPSAEWSGPNFIDVAEARMAELEPPIGQPYSAQAVASVFEMPSNFPVLAGTITGIFNVWEVDIRDGEISQERIVGTDTIANKEDLKAHGAPFLDDETAPWKFPSISDGGDNYLALFTSQAESEPGQRLALLAFQEPEPNEPSFQWKLEIEPSEIVAPSWVASLPIPEGGTLDGFREGTGLVEDFGTLAEGGYLEISMSYPETALPALEAFYSTDIIKQAGFQYEDTPFNNQNIRIDLSIGEWSGRMSVWKGSYGDTTYYGVTWSLVRPVK